MSKAEPPELDQSAHTSTTDRSLDECAPQRVFGFLNASMLSSVADPLSAARRSRGMGRLGLDAGAQRQLEY